MTYIAHIRRESDGVVREYAMDGCDWHGPYVWKEGNFHCDCNRGLFFDRASGVEDPEDDDEEGDCTYGSYAVRITDLDGNDLYVDDQWNKCSFTAGTAS